MNKKPLRLVVTALVPKSSDYDGKTGGLVRMAEILKRLGRSDEVEIILISSDENYADFFRKNGISFEFKSVKSKFHFKNLSGLGLKSLFIIAKSLLVLNTDFLKSREKEVVIYSSSDLFWEVIPAYIYKKNKKNLKWVQVVHHVYPDWKKRPGRKKINFLGYYLQKFSFRLIKKRADRIISVSSVTQKELVKAGISENRISLSSNGVDIDYFEKIQKAETEYDGVFLGRLNYSKGLADLVEIWKNVCREIPEARLAIVGGGNEEMKNFAEKKISDNGLEKNIKLLGFLEDEKAHLILKSGKIFLFPSHEEGWGIAIAEAMACGLPVVSWDLPVYTEVFGNQTLQIGENDISLFSRKVVELLQNAPLRRDLGAKGKEYIKKYSWDEVAKNEMGIIREK
jgi:glycosyltransferase involved in cell wall biosynthesis